MNQKTTDGLNYISKLSISRVWNMVKVFSSFCLSKWTKRPIQWGIPISLTIEPTTSCNLRCPECPSGLREFTRPTGMLQNEFFKSHLKKFKKEKI